MKMTVPYNDNFKIVTEPFDATPGFTGGRIKLANAERVYFHVLVAAGLAGTLTYTLKQHNAASGGTSKVISINGSYYVKYDTATVFTKVDIAEGSEASAFALGAGIAATKAYVIFEVEASQLDVDNGFYWASLDGSATGVAATRITAVMAQLQNVAFKPAYAISC